MPVTDTPIMFRDDRPSATNSSPEVADVPAVPALTPCGQVQVEIADLQRRVTALEVIEGVPVSHDPVPPPPLRPAPDSPDAAVGNDGAEAIPVAPPAHGPNGPGSVPTPALSRVQGPDPIAGIGYMTTSATVNQQGVLYASTTTHSVKDLEGFTGGVFAIVADAGGAIIARSGIHQFGVDGLWIPGSISSRTDNWTETFSPQAAANGHTLGIVHIWDPKNRFFTDLAQVLRDVETVLDLLRQLCTAEPIICSVVTAAL